MNYEEFIRINGNSKTRFRKHNDTKRILKAEHIKGDTITLSNGKTYSSQTVVSSVVNGNVSLANHSAIKNMPIFSMSKSFRERLVATINKVDRKNLYYELYETYMLVQNGEETCIGYRDLGLIDACVKTYEMSLVGYIKVYPLSRPLFSSGGLTHSSIPYFEVVNGKAYILGKAGEKRYVKVE